MKFCSKDHFAGVFVCTVPCIGQILEKLTPPHLLITNDYTVRNIEIPQQKNYEIKIVKIVENFFLHPYLKLFLKINFPNLKSHRNENKILCRKN